MKIAGICFTTSGARLAGRIQNYFLSRPDAEKMDFSFYIRSRFASSENEDSLIFLQGSLRDWTKEQFANVDALIFIGATGIAVRAIAPFVRSKRTDPAVLCLDERGKFCISLLSGHIGGANALAGELSAALGSIPVITTATDINERFAVDVFARENDLAISNMTYAKEISAALLSGETVGLSSSYPVDGDLPEGIYWTDRPHRKKEHSEEDLSEGTTLGLSISPSYSRAWFDHTLFLIPRVLILGIGCKRGTPAEKIERFVAKVLQSNSLFEEALFRVASIDLKKDEPGILSFCRTHDLPFVTYSAAQLSAVPGEFTESRFVYEQTGVGNVCERSAIRAGGERLLVRKTSRHGMTAAIAEVSYRILFNK